MRGALLRQHSTGSTVNFQAQARLFGHEGVQFGLQGRGTGGEVGRLAGSGRSLRAGMGRVDPGPERPDSRLHLGLG